MASDTSDDDSLEFVDAEVGEVDYSESVKSADSDHFEDASQDINEHKVTENADCLGVKLENVEYKTDKVEDTPNLIDSLERLSDEVGVTESSIDTDTVNVKDLSLYNEDNKNQDDSDVKVVTKDNNSEINVVTKDLEGEEIHFSEHESIDGATGSELDHVNVSETTRLDNDSDIAEPDVFIDKDGIYICNENDIVVQEIQTEQCLPQQSIYASEDSEIKLILPVQDTGYFEDVSTTQIGLSVGNEPVTESETTISLETDSNNRTSDVDIDNSQCTLIVEQAEGVELSNLSLKSSDKVTVNNIHEISSDELSTGSISTDHDESVELSNLSLKSSDEVIVKEFEDNRQEISSDELCTASLSNEHAGSVELSNLLLKSSDEVLAKECEDNRQKISSDELSTASICNEHPGTVELSNLSLKSSDKVLVKECEDNRQKISSDELCTASLSNEHAGVELSNLLLKSSDEVTVKEGNDNKHEVSGDEHSNVVQSEIIESQDFVSDDMPKSDEASTLEYSLSNMSQAVSVSGDVVELQEAHLESSNVQDNINEVVTDRFSNESISDSSHLSGESFDEIHNEEQGDNLTDNTERDMNVAHGCNLDATQEVYEEETPVQDFFDTPLMIGHPLSLQLRVIPMPWPIQIVMNTPADQVLRDEDNFIQNISQFYNQQAISDVLLKIGDLRYYGHKFVLAKSSDVFRTMLYERPWSQGSTEEVELNESPECVAVFDKFLRYLYTAEVMISTEAAVGILCLADKYNVGSLKELCVKYMADNAKSPRINNALTWYPWSKALHLEDLHEQCTRTIGWNCTDLIASPDWLNMDVEFICDVLESPEMVIQDEYVLFEAVTAWLTHPSHMHQMQEYAQRLLGLIRFPQMMVAQLYQIEHSDIASSIECGELVSQLIGRAYRFRAICPNQEELSVSFNESFYIPRDYYHLTVDTVKISNSLRFQVDVKMYYGPVPKENKDGDWRLTYRRSTDLWTVQIYCHESAMVHGRAKFQATLMIYNENEKVIQVERAPVFTCCRGTHQNFQISVNDPEEAKSMSLLIKPLPD